MSRPPIHIKDLVKGNHVWKMHIRIVDLWVVKEKSGQQHIELVIQDGKGDQIHVMTRNRDFKDWVEQLKEHQTYALYNGEPVDNDGLYKVCSNCLKLVFNGGTTISEIAIPEIPPHHFKFKAIGDFLNGVFQTDMLYDVIGILEDVVKTQMGGGGKKSCANITLRDEHANVVEVALWDDYGKQFMNYNMANKIDGPTIIVLTHAWCKKNAVSGLPSLSNAWNGSRLHINLDHPQVETFKASISLASTQDSRVSSHSLIQPGDSSIQSTNTGWTSPNEVKTICHINALGKDCFATTIGTTKRFKASKHGWYFESFPSCKTSNKSPGEVFVCTCGVKNVEPITKFKIEVEVEYENHVGCFVFWDKDCMPYVEMTAKQLREVMRETGEDNPRIYPAHLDKLLDKNLAFRIKYQSFFQQFSIVTIIKDDDVYKNLNNMLNPNEHTSNDVVSKYDTITPNEVQHHPIITPSAEHTNSAYPSMPATQTFSPSASSSNTPAKRVAISTSLDELFEAEDLTPKQSATKAKHLKKE